MDARSIESNALAFARHVIVDLWGQAIGDAELHAIARRIAAAIPVVRDAGQTAGACEYDGCDIREPHEHQEAIRYLAPEVSPRSSGGAPNEPDGLTFAELDAIEAALNRGGARSVGSINTRVLVNELRRARTQVSALRQEAAAHGALDKEFAAQLRAARQEAETLRKQLDGLSKLNAENVKIGEGAHKVASAGLNAVVELGRAETASRAEIERLTQEAETLRGQLEAQTGELEAARNERGSANKAIGNANYHLSRGTFDGNIDAKNEIQDYLSRRTAARVAAPREPTNG